MLNLKEVKAKDRLIVALDFYSEEKALELVEELGESVSFYKVGLELFLLSKTEIFFKLKQLGKKVFLDLKFYDIPQTMAGASDFPIHYNAEFFTVHCSAGLQALQNVTLALKNRNSNALALGVTVLTSFSEDSFKITYNTNLNIKQATLHFTGLAQQAGCAGVICSPLEAPLIKEKWGHKIITVCPGVRYEEDEKHDQQRVNNPYSTIKNGADFIVVGRSITTSSNKAHMAERIIKDINRGLNDRKEF